MRRGGASAAARHDPARALPWQRRGRGGPARLAQPCRAAGRSAGVEIVDLASANGTFVNGQRVMRAPVGQRDVIAIGHHLYQLEGDSLVEYVDSGDVAFEVQGVSVFAGRSSSCTT
ncbi:FHA domain-containing protein [Parafrankia sp. CH37]|uniref:FHA domain-containing protein n=1 Tax=Parafrankia sp. CH37 TaxID=683308 RepID=UPI0037C7BC82